MSCTCKYGSGRVCGFCEHRARVNERLKKLEDAQASEFARGVAAERARVVAWLRERPSGGNGHAAEYWMAYLADAIERGEHEEKGFV